MNGTTRTRRGIRRVLGLSLGGAMIMAMAPGVASAQAPTPDARTTDDVCDPLSAYDRDRFDDTRGSAHERNVLCMEDYGLTEGLRGGDSYGPRLDVNRGQMASFIARFIEDATGEELEEGEGFRDVPGSYVHSENINKIENIGVSEGTRRSDGEEFDPLADVSRGQMASFISRALTYIEDGHGQPETVPPRAAVDYFADDNRSVHEDNINALADVGIVQGFDDGTYRWSAAVKRDQMASFVMRAYDYLVAEDIGGPGDTVAPSLVSSVPADEATDVPLDTTVSATFSEDIAEGTVELVCDGDAVEGATVIEDETITFTPTDDLANDADCTATFTVEDAAGNDTTVTTTFTTVAAMLEAASLDVDMIDTNGDTGTISTGDEWTLTFNDAIDTFVTDADTGASFVVDTDSAVVTIQCDNGDGVGDDAFSATCELNEDGTLTVTLDEDATDEFGDPVMYPGEFLETDLVTADGDAIVVTDVVVDIDGDTDTVPLPTP